MRTCRVWWHLLARSLIRTLAYSAALRSLRPSTACQPAAPRHRPAIRRAHCGAMLTRILTYQQAPVCAFEPNSSLLHTALVHVHGVHVGARREGGVGCLMFLVSPGKGKKAKTPVSYASTPAPGSVASTPTSVVNSVSWAGISERSCHSPRDLGYSVVASRGIDGKSPSTAFKVA